MGPKGAAGAREKIVDSAINLFYTQGYYAVGVAEIVEDSGVPEETVSELIGGKDDLILAALRARDERFREYAAFELSQRTEDPAERLVMLFDLFADWFAEPDFSGCMFINAAADYSKPPGDPIHTAAAEHKRLLQAYLCEQAEEAGAADPDHLSAQIALLIEGAVTSAHVVGAKDAAGTAKEIAAQLVARATV